MEENELKDYEVRVNCEYVTTIRAVSKGDAEQKAVEVDLADWDQAWSEMEAEEL